MDIGKFVWSLKIRTWKSILYKAVAFQSGLSSNDAWKYKLCILPGRLLYPSKHTIF